MRKTGFVGLIVFLLSGMSLFAQQQPDYSKVEIKVQKIAGSVYMLQGMGGNIGASVGDDGIVVIDDEFLPLADKIEAALKSITDKPVKFVINTHWHGDHTGGNPHFGEKAPDHRAGKRTQAAFHRRHIALRNHSAGAQSGLCLSSPLKRM